MRLVTVELHREDDGWWAETADLPGYTAADPDLNELRRLLRDGLEEFLGEPVVLRELVPGGHALFESREQSNIVGLPPETLGRRWSPLIVTGPHLAVPAY
jgi:predicted RNase H-like HicB family nuclease